MKVLFMGTPDFATACLDALVCDGFDVAAVITQPDKKQGRGMKFAFSDVKKYAIEKNLPVFQPETLKDGAIADLLCEIKPDVIAVVAYGKLLPQYVLEYPKYGCVNVHGSLLPKYRGAAPIQRAVLNGDKETGITTMFMASGMDTGDILLTEKMEIGENMTTGELFDALAVVGGKLLVETLKGLESGSVTPVPQNHDEATHAEKITNEECLVDFTLDADEVHNRIRGLSPFPGAFSYLDGKVIKLFNSKKGTDEAKGQPGEVISASAKTGVEVCCGKGSVIITSFKPEGKGVMTAADLINGRKIAVGSKFGE